MTGALSEVPGTRPILIVDDEPHAVEMLCELLESLGHTAIHTTSRSAEAVELCARVDPDLVLLDVQMPRPNGIELLSAIRSSPPPMAHVPVLVVTADSAGDTHVQALAAGASDFLLKPIDLSEATLRITNLLAHRALQRQLEAESAALEVQVQQRIEHLHATVAQLEAAVSERRNLVINLIKAEEKQRGQIASDMHNDPLHVMAATRRRLGMLRAQLANAEPEVVANIQSLEATMTDAVARLRRLVFDLHPRSLDHVGIVAALEDYLRTTNIGPLRWKVESQLHVELPTEVRVVLYRIAQEALTNVRKHAHASNVTITINEQDGGVRLQIKDNGHGFTAGDRAGRRIDHFGLRSMRERAEATGGRWHIQTAPGEGTTIEAWLPTTPGTRAP